MVEANAPSNAAVVCVRACILCLSLTTGAREHGKARARVWAGRRVLCPPGHMSVNIAQIPEGIRFCNDALNSFHNPAWRELTRERVGSAGVGTIGTMLNVAGEKNYVTLSDFVHT